MRKATLTSDGNGDATASTSSVSGRLVKIEVLNSTTAQPSNNWDLTLYTGTASGNNYEVLFLDATVSQAITSKVKYYPVAVASKAADGDDSTLTEVPPLVLSQPINLIGANMGDTKSAEIRLLFEV